MTDYRYPLEEELVRVEKWDGDWRACFAFVRSLWWMPDWGWHESTEIDNERVVTRYQISTGGWSGNEDVVTAMEHNRWLMSFFWMESRRGGHYVFELPDALADMRAHEPPAERMT
jgi:hypothetical protein